MLACPPVLSSHDWTEGLLDALLLLDLQQLPPGDGVPAERDHEGVALVQGLDQDGDDRVALLDEQVELVVHTGGVILHLGMISKTYVLLIQEKKVNIVVENLMFWRDSLHPYINKILREDKTNIKKPTNC